MACFPITQRCTSPAFLITRRLRRVCSRCRGEIWRGSCSGSVRRRQPHWGGGLCCNAIREVTARVPALKGGAAGQQVLPCDRHLREVRGSAPAPLWMTCRNAARRAQLGKIAIRGLRERKRRDSIGHCLSFKLCSALIFSFPAPGGLYLPGIKTARALIRGRFDQCRRQFVLAAQHVVKLRSHC